MKILSIQSSPNIQNSNTREASLQLIQELKTKYPQAEVVTRDLSTNPVPHITPLTLGSFFTPEEKRTPEQKNAIQYSNELVNEFLGADLIIIGSPMYNFSIPSSLKAYIDGIVRAGITFKYTEQGPQGLVSNAKKVAIVTSAGGVYTGTPYAAMDLNEIYLKSIFGFLGINKFYSIKVEGTAMGVEAVTKAKQHASDDIKTVVSSI